ncbi:large ribosomal subunit protein mL48-like [Saccostrea echinata]|uniref:large ribosomal subunit protein mL48-like n=1 Tax=Saccostrea echinata TaxID=191078 RepID=UPI002A7F152A|nr:large ribosomal subunit protein mL48-like [Saccostrea echinata]
MAYKEVSSAKTRYLKQTQLGKALRLVSSEFNKTLCKRCQNNVLHKRKWFTTGSKLCGVWEPDGLDEPKIGEYKNIDIQLTGYDFVVLESFCRFVKSVKFTMDLDMKIVTVPPRSLNVKTYHTRSTKVQEIFNLKRYERKLRFKSVVCTKFPIFLEVLRKHQPEGVDIQIMEFSKEVEDFRYIPSDEKLNLLARLKALEKEKIEREKRKDK